MHTHQALGRLAGLGLALVVLTAARSALPCSPSHTLELLETEVEGVLGGVLVVKARQDSWSTIVVRDADGTVLEEGWEDWIQLDPHWETTGFPPPARTGLLVWRAAEGLEPNTTLTADFVTDWGEVTSIPFTTSGDEYRPPERYREIWGADARRLVTSWIRCAGTDGDCGPCESGYSRWTEVTVTLSPATGDRYTVYRLVPVFGPDNRANVAAWDADADRDTVAIRVAERAEEYCFVLQAVNLHGETELTEDGVGARIVHELETVCVADNGEPEPELPPGAPMGGSDVGDAIHADQSTDGDESTDAEPRTEDADDLVRTRGGSGCSVARSGGRVGCPTAVLLMAILAWHASGPALRRRARSKGGPDGRRA
jgi:hypothetical protein